jgi:WD40 repeat protein
MVGWFEDVTFLGAYDVVATNLYCLFSTTLRKRKNIHIVTSGYNCVIVLNLETKLSKFVYQHDEFKDIRAIKELKNGSIAIGAHDGCIHLWNPHLPSVKILQVEKPSPVRAIAELHDGNLISGSYDDPCLTIWDMKTYSVLKRIRAHRRHVLCLEIIDKNHIVTGSSDEKMHIWNLTKGKCEVTMNCTSSVWKVRVDQTGYIYNCQSDKKVCKWDPKTGQCLAFVSLPGPYLNTFALLPNGSILAGTSSGLYLANKVLNSAHQLADYDTEEVLVLDDGSAVLGILGRKILHFDIANGKVKSTMKQNATVKAIAIIRF